MKQKWLVTLLISIILALLFGKGEFVQISPRNFLLASSKKAVVSLAPLPVLKTGEAQELLLPDNAGYVNVKDFDAQGDGVTDDTEALKTVLGQNKRDPGGAVRSIYFPNGVYLVSDTLGWGDKKKDVRGQSRDGVIIKLKDNCSGFQDAKHPRKVLQIEFDHGGQNFNQRLRNLTVDVGKGNSGAVGIGFHTNNSGGVYDIIVRSSDPERRGHTGLMLDKAWPGPGFIKNVYVDGFDTGIFITHDQYSMTFEHLTLINQRKVGFVNSWNTVAIRDLKSENRVPAVENRGKMALMALVEAKLIGGDGSLPAIINHKEGVLFARDIQTEGYRWALDNQSGQRRQVADSSINEFVSHPVSSLFPSPQKSLRLPIEDPPVIPYGDPSTWVSVTEFGAGPNDKEDDGPAIQAAIDSGAETVYLPAGNYRSQQSIRVRGNVRHLFGLNALLVFKTPDQPGFIVEDGQYDTVTVDVHSTYGNESSHWVEHASKRTLVLGSGSYINTVPGGKVFIEDTTAVPLVFDHQQVWIRQINTESYDYNPHIVNKGSDLWILGLKTEKDRTIIGTYEGGRTEVIGGLLYKNRERIGPAPAFVTEDGAISLVYRNKGKPYQTQVLEQRNGETKEFHVQDIPASYWRMPLYVGYKGNVH